MVLLLPALLLGGCRAREQRLSRTWYDAFDTVFTLSVYAADEAAFERAAQAFEEGLYRLDAVFDGFEEHPGVQGVYALNNAGGAWVEVEPELYDLLEQARAWGAGERVNPALGTVTELWRQARERGTQLPSAQALAQAAEHVDFDALELSQGRARLTDAQTRLDLGAIAKGYAARELEKAVAEQFESYLIDAGGTVLAGGAPLDGRECWSVGVRNPQDGGVLLTLGLRNLCAATSADDQRYFTLEGVNYHHLIDPQTLYPARYMRQATAIAADAGYADYLSTLLFLMPVEQALLLAESLEGVEAILVTCEGATRMTSGAGELVTS